MEWNSLVHYMNELILVKCIKNQFGENNTHCMKTVNMKNGFHWNLEHILIISNNVCNVFGK